MDEPTNIISLSKKRRELGRCRHIRILVDEDLAYVECRDCGEKLNPILILARFATEESRWLNEYRHHKKWMAEYEKRKRVKCFHCGEMTPVRVKI